MSDQQHITVAQAGPLGIISIDRPQAMNALTLDMVRNIDRALDRFENDLTIDRVLLRSDTDRAFCAGGDMRRIRALSLAQNFADAEQFFWEEYSLIQRMSGYEKTIIALVDGVCMGGGLGLVMQSDVRVATDRAKFAMPETAIGFFPDVGGSYFLSRMPHFGGFWMGLTGAQVASFDAQTLGISTHMLLPGDVKGFERALGAPEAALDTVLETFCAAPVYQSSMLSLAANTLCFNHSTLCGIKECLSKRTALGSETARQALDKVSPRSLQETMRLLRHGRDASLKNCLTREFEAMQRAIRHPDLAEGVRAVLVDKDHAPCWQ